MLPVVLIWHILNIDYSGFFFNKVLVRKEFVNYLGVGGEKCFDKLYFPLGCKDFSETLFEACLLKEKN